MYLRCPVEWVETCRRISHKTIAESTTGPHDWFWFTQGAQPHPPLHRTRPLNGTPGRLDAGTPIGSHGVPHRSVGGSQHSTGRRHGRASQLSATKSGTIGTSAGTTRTGRSLRAAQTTTYTTAQILCECPALVQI